MNEGDYFRWSYKQHVIDKRQDCVRAGTLYWCRAKVAVVKNGCLVDIYWSNMSEGRRWTEEDARKDLVLTFLCNKNDMEETEDPEYYESADVIDIRHPNMMRGGIYIRKGAKKSKAVMKELIQKEIHRYEHELESAQYSINRLRGQLLEIETADLDKFWI